MGGGLGLRVQAGGLGECGAQGLGGFGREHAQAVQGVGGALLEVCQVCIL